MLNNKTFYCITYEWIILVAYSHISVKVKWVVSIVWFSCIYLSVDYWYAQNLISQYRRNNFWWISFISIFKCILPFSIFIFAHASLIYFNLRRLVAMLFRDPCQQASWVLQIEHHYPIFLIYSNSFIFNYHLLPDRCAKITWY